jgi:Fe-S-cluster containining protein
MTIDDLYSMIPSVPCPPGCITCCKKFGVPSRIPEEDARIKAFLKEHGISGRVNDFEVSEGDNTCPYVTTKGCAIYPVRPFICRLYGTSPNYLCIENVRPAVLLSAEEEEQLLFLYSELAKKQKDFGMS